MASAPYHPSTNGLAERAVHTVKQGIKPMEGVSLEEKLSQFLHIYRITPHSTTGISPSELLMGKRQMRKCNNVNVLLYHYYDHYVFPDLWSH